MKTYIHLDSKNESSYSVWKDGPVTFTKLIPPSKVVSILEVCGDIRLASLSLHYDYLVVTNGFKEDKETLYLTHLKEKKVEVLKSVTYATSVIYFMPDNENSLLVGSHCGRIFHFNINGGKDVQVLEGHRSPPNKISGSSRSAILITCSSTEVLVWSWPHGLLTRRLKIEPNHVVIEGGHISEKDYIFVCFESGVVLLWDRGQGMKEHAIEPPEGVTMHFKSFTASADGDWIIGVGSEALIVIYSVASHKVVQVVHFSHQESLLGVNYVQFLPSVHPQYPKTFLVVTSSCVIIVDFLTTTLVKVLKSHRYSIQGVCVSGDGFVLGVTYANGTTKLYTLLSFYPEPSKQLKSLDPTPEVKFTVIKTSDKSKKKKIASLLDETKWTTILEEYEEYPEKYRKHIWVSVLRLPRNFSILNEILIKDKKHKFESLGGEVFLDLDKTVLETLTSTLECLCYWSPFLSSVEFLPSFVLPIVEFFEPNLLLCFEASLFIILNWCSLWFENWPSPPATLLKLVDTLVCENDADLWVHLQRIHFSVDHYTWPLLTTAFRQVLTKEDWLIMWDNILSNPPSFVVCLCAAFTLCLRTTLLKCSQLCYAQQVYSQETWIPVRTILKKAKRLRTSLTFEDEEVKRKMSVKRFLPKGALLPFDIGPPQEPLLQTIFTSSRMTPSVRCRAGFQGGAKRKEEKEVESLPPKMTSSVKTKSFLQTSASSATKGLGVKRSTRILTAEMEELCLRNIQKTRRKQLAKYAHNNASHGSHK